ncbi:MAG TPA: pyridoxamine 5'-phosphate oxidase family protein [Dermatophilaceae bacterium]|nr:pyridoxamine 5'-phosphate oxidase family protein [Dermatophilaceae bacterium]
MAAHGSEHEGPPLMAELSVSECWALMRESPVGRLAVTVDGQPEIFPVNHVVDHGSVVFRTAAGTKLSGCLGRPVAFEVDGYDLVTATAWSVVAKGTAREILSADEALAALQLPVLPWHNAPKPRFVRLAPDNLTGRRFAVAGGVRS